MQLRGTALAHHGRFVQVYSMSPFIYAGMYLAFIQECNSPNLVAHVNSSGKSA